MIDDLKFMLAVFAVLAGPAFLYLDITFIWAYLNALATHPIR